MRKADRLFQMVNLIRVHQPITAARLAERLEVSVRTVYRYMDDLSLGGIPVYGEAGVGYALHQGFELPPLNLTGPELEALSVAVQWLSHAAGDELAQHARSLRAKVQAALPAPWPALGHMPMASPLASEVISPIASPWPLLAPHAMKCWDALRRAIHARQALRLHYVSLQGAASARDVYPLGLFYWGGKWTVGAWCTLRGDYRDFRVDLIDQLAPAPSPAPRPPQADLRAYRARQAQAWRTATDKTLSAALADTGSSYPSTRSEPNEKPGRKSRQ